MAEVPHAALLERATRAIEGIDRTLARQEAAFERQEKTFERQDAAFNEMLGEWRAERALTEERHRQLLERSRAGERIFIEAISDIDASIKRSNERLDDMGEAIRANTAAVLSVLDRLNPGTT